jgi:hypothetical protein
MGYWQKLGAYTAKGGFENEADIVFKFNDYKNDHEAKAWLDAMGYDCEKIQRLKAARIPVRFFDKREAISFGATEENFEESMKFQKADVQIKLCLASNEGACIKNVNVSLKKANVGAGYNQVDKRPVDRYKKIWNIPESVCETLKLYTGEIKPANPRSLRDERRMFLDEIERPRVYELIQFFAENKTLVFNDVLRGRGAFAAEWMLVTRKNKSAIERTLRDINFACNFFAEGPVRITDMGNLKIGRMTAQRKGGTPDPESLQFKLNPLDLFGTVAGKQM